MKLIKTTIIAALGLCLALGRADAQEEFLATPVPPAWVNQSVFSLTGLTLNYTDDFSWAGACSGAVAVDRRVMLSAAHCVYNPENTSNPWIPNTEFFLQWNNSQPPQPKQGKALRGYYVLTDYSSALGMGSEGIPRAYDTDFSAHFGYEPLATQAIGISEGNITAMKSNIYKMITGYPAGLYTDGDPNQYKMHYSGPFTTPCEQAEGSLMFCENVQSGHGNSGGPTFGYNSNTQSWWYLGTLVGGANKGPDLDFNFVAINAFEEEEAALVRGALESAQGNTGGNDNPSGNTEEPLPPYIYVTGNKVHITPGDTTPGKEDGTNFGIATKKKSIKRSFVIANLGDQPLSFTGNKSITIRGPGAKYFKLRKIKVSSLQPLQGIVLPITFKASPKKSFKATVVISSDAQNAPTYSFAIKAKRK